MGREVQRDVFRRQVAIAHETGLPLVLHMRDAHDDGFAILEEEGWPAAGVLLHCCSVGPDELRRWLDRGCYVAFGGAVTFARSDELRASEDDESRSMTSFAAQRRGQVEIVSTSRRFSCIGVSFPGGLYVLQQLSPRPLTIIACVFSLSHLPC